MKACLLALVLCLSAVPAFAQVPPVINPGGVEFTPSPDHDLVANGAPIVAKYTLEIAASTSPGTVVKAVDLGKPAIVGGKVTSTSLTPAFSTLAVGSYVAVVKAEGPGGTASSVASDPFLVRAPAPTAPGRPVWKQ